MPNACLFFLQQDPRSVGPTLGTLLYGASVTETKGRADEANCAASLDHCASSTFH